jgi:hypothetical protein
MFGKILLALILIFVSCKHENKNKNEELIKHLIVLELYQRIQVKPCREYYGQPNSMLMFPEYYDKFMNTNSFTNLVLGDSTMDISTRYTDYLSSNSYSLAIGGNTACDVLEQMSLIAIKTDNVIFSTNDGNGGLRNVDVNKIRETNNEVVRSIKEKLKPKIIVVVLLHPTMLSKLESKRQVINANFINDNKDVCSILPDELFTLVNGLSTELDMIDTIHYNQRISFGIKDLILKKCNVGL